MRCPECNGRGETIYFVETERDEYSVTVEQRQGVCRTCHGSGEKPKTNADRIRAMDDETLATQLVQVVKETFEMLANADMPDDLANEIWVQLLEKLKQPAEEDNDGRNPE